MRLPVSVFLAFSLLLALPLPSSARVRWEQDEQEDRQSDQQNQEQQPEQEQEQEAEEEEKPEPPRPTHVWAEYGVTTIHVGRDRRGYDVFRKVLLGAIGPTTVVPLSAHDAVRTCSRTALLFAGDGLHPLLDLQVDAFTLIDDELQKVGQPINQQTVNASHRARIDQISAIFAKAASAFDYRLDRCLSRHPELVKSFRVGIVLRVCTPMSSQPCEGSAFTKRPLSRSYDRFHKVYEWLRTFGFTSANLWQHLEREGTVTPELSQPVELYRWPDAPATAVQIHQFEIGALEHRRRRSTYAYPVAALVGLDKTSTLHALDVFESPIRTVALLASETQELTEPLKILSDEIARTRIIECATFRSDSDAASVTKCSGYRLTNQLLAECLTGQRCLPEFNDTALGSVLPLNTTRSKAQLVSAAALPRIDPNGTLGDFETSARQCHTESPRDASSAAICLLKSRSSPEARQMLECAQTAGTNHDERLECLTSALGTDAQKRLAACFARVAVDKEGAALCATFEYLPPEAQRAVACLQEYDQTGDSAAAALCIGGDQLGPNAQIAAQCIAAHQDGWSDAAVCVVAQKADIPPAARDALECSESAADLESVANCMVGKNLPEVSGDLGRFARCYAIERGEGLAVAACMMEDQLTPEQRITLKCAAHSKTPASFALCTGGQLAIREFVKCQGRRVGGGMLRR
jgi:hypothetical protein